MYLYNTYMLVDLGLDQIMKGICAVHCLLYIDFNLRKINSASVKLIVARKVFVKRPKGHSLRARGPLVGPWPGPPFGQPWSRQ